MCSSGQIPSLSDKFPTYKSFAEADLDTIYSKDKLEGSLILKAELFESSMIINNGADGFEIKPLPNEAQFAPISGLVINDFNRDKALDILYGGNFYATEVETVRYDASIGGLLLNNGKSEFSSVSSKTHGFIVPDNVRDIKIIKLGKSKQTGILVSNNDNKLQLFKSNQN